MIVLQHPCGIMKAYDKYNILTKRLYHVRWQSHDKTSTRKDRPTPVTAPYTTLGRQSTGPPHNHANHEVLFYSFSNEIHTWLAFIWTEFLTIVSLNCNYWYYFRGGVTIHYVMFFMFYGCCKIDKVKRIR